MTETTIKRVGDEHKSTIANLIQLYLYDMTGSMPFPIGADGRLEYDFLDRCWRYPYLIRVEDDIAGFALVIDECPLTGRQPCWFMAEFFILKAYRRRGAGRAALAAIVQEHPGDWHLGVPIANRPALEFWGRVLAPRSPASREIAFDGDRWRLHAFRA